MVTKPHIEVIRSLCHHFEHKKELILFRFSLGSTDTSRLRFWEPEAPTFAERMRCLRYGYDAGFETSISCEPMLDTRTEALILKTMPYVTDAVWVGKPNLLFRRLRANGEADQTTMNAARSLMKALSDDFILDLYDRFRGESQVKWKDSIKKIVGIPLSEQRGADI